MIEKQRGHVESINVVSPIRNGFAKMEIRIDFDIFIIFYNPAEIMSFINQDVFYTTRPDIVEGREVEVIAEIALVSEVATIDANKNDVKLIPFDVKRPVCNFNIKDVKFGEYKLGCIAILTKIERGASRKASWFDCEMLDAYGHLFSVRIFVTPEQTDEISQFDEMLNGYVEFNMESTKYGFQSTELRMLDQKIEASPEIAIARNETMKYILSDPAINQMVNDYKLDQYIDLYIDGEPGYQWVRMASELYFIDALDNVTSGVNVTSMKRAVVCTRLFVLPHNSDWSKTVLIVTKALRYKELLKDEELRSIIDVFYNKEFTNTKKLYIDIRKMVNKIINARRDIEDEEKIVDFVNGCYSTFDGLL